MTLELYNTLSRTKEEFAPISKKQVTMYSCGPTVYWHQHIGNIRSYIFADLLKRTLQFNGYKVKHIINVTDIGHLTSDADDGEDKMEKAAKKEGKTAQEIATYYFDEFLKDYKETGLIEPEKWTWATKYIDEQIGLVQQLEKKGFTYKTSDGIYFDTSKFSDYGKISKKQIKNLEAGKRIDLKEKQNITDFVLWKFSKPEDKRQQEYQSPWGVGFPGWHIECSAMAIAELGQTIDIHTGGEDHIPIHHENEIAQSECATGKKFVNYWLHNAFVEIAGGKMSKSKGTIKRVTDLIEMGISPLAYKLYTYSAVYRKPLAWKIDNVKTAQEQYKTLRRLTTQLEDDSTVNQEYLDKFTEAINDDLNTPQAIAILWELLRDTSATGKYQAVEKMDKVLALHLLKKEQLDIPEEVQKIAKERQTAREKKDWTTSDKLRDQIQELGYKIKDMKDTKNTYTFEKI
jgi:cysteinyl-tRNA synthetase